jgi:hypothetical protein
MIRRLMAAPLALAVVLAPVAFAASSCACGSSAAAATSGSSGGCSGSAVQPCSPSAQRSNAFGRIGVQQAGPRKTIQWGVYPTNSFGTMTIQITIGGANVLGPYTKPYAQHGSIPYDPANKRYLASGDVLSITGTWVTSKDSEGFYFQCKLA